ncbi:MAG: hypothetical protein ACI9D0_002081 [Bacteroidia bacterium]|jgi:hypothetical protein
MQKAYLLILAICAVLTAGFMLRTPASVEGPGVDFTAELESSSGNPIPKLSLGQGDSSEPKERTSIARLEEGESLRGGVELVGELVTQKEGILYLGEIPLTEVSYDKWEMTDLRDVMRQIRPFQIVEMRRIKAAMPTDHLFVTVEDYTSQRRWHEDLVMYGSSRKVALDSGDMEIEYGYLAITPGMSDTAFGQRDEVVRIYSAPSYAAYLLQRGIARESDVLEKHPHAITDVTSDLTHWTFFDPDGSIVGSFHSSKYGNN